MKKILNFIISIIVCMTMTSCPDDEMPTTAEIFIDIRFEDEFGLDLSKTLTLRGEYLPPSTSSNGTRRGTIDPADYKLKVELSSPSVIWSEDFFPPNPELEQYIASLPPKQLLLEPKGFLYWSANYPLTMAKQHVLSLFLVCPKIFGDNQEHELKTYWSEVDEERYRCNCFCLECDGKEMKSVGENRFVVTVKSQE